MSKPAPRSAFKVDFSKPMDTSEMMDAFKMPNFDMNTLMEMQRKNIEALTVVNQAIFQNLQSFAGRQVEMMRQGFEETTDLINVMMSAPTTQEKVMHHAEASKIVTEKCMAHARDAAETLAKCNSHAMETVSNRMNEGLGELRSLIKTNVAA
jgi:phasin family protein